MNMPRLLSIALLLALVSGGLGCSAEAKKERALARAVEHFKAGKRREAKIECLNVLRTEPGNTKAHEMLATLWFEQGSMLRAMPHLQKLVEMNGNDRQSRHRMAEINLALGKVSAAHREAISILERQKDDGRALMMLVETIRSPDELEKAKLLLPKNPLGDLHATIALGTMELRSGDIQGAKRLFQRAIAIDDKSPDAHLAMGKFHLAQNERDAALKEYTRTAELAPLRSANRLVLAQYKARIGAMDEAVALFQAVSKQAPDYLPALLGEAEIAFAQKKLDRAQELATQIIKQDGAHYETLVLNARIALAKGEVDSAITQLEKVSAAVPNLSNDKYYLARAYMLKKDREKAIAAMVQAVRMNPDNEQAIVELGQLRIVSGQGEVAARELIECLMIRPSFVRVQVLLTDALRAMGRHEDAIKVTQEHIKMRPKSPQLHVVLGMLQAEQKRLPEARAAFEKALEIAPDTGAAIAQLIDLDVREKKYDAARARAKAVLAKNPDAAEGYFFEAGILAAQQKWEEAEAQLWKVVELNETHGRAYELLLLSYMMGKRLPQGVQKVEAQLAKKPDNVPALLLGAMLNYQTKDYAKARDHYEKTLAVRPDAQLALNNLAYLYAEHLNNLDRALELGTKIRELEPANANVADTLGWILYKRKEYPKALELLEDAATKLPRSAEVHYHLGRTHEAMGNKDKAREAYEKAAAGTGEFEGKTDIKNRLASLGAK